MYTCMLADHYASISPYKMVYFYTNDKALNFFFVLVYGHTDITRILRAISKLHSPDIFSCNL